MNKRTKKPNRFEERKGGATYDDGTLVDEGKKVLINTLISIVNQS